MLSQIVNLMKSLKIDGFFTTMDDEHLNEFVSEQDNRIRKLTGFTGSSGMAFTSKDHRFLITDGRYHLQAEKESREYKLLDESKLPGVWKNLDSIRRIGIDTRYISYSQYNKLKRMLNENKIELIHIDDIVFTLWKDRPPRVIKEVIDLEKFSYRNKVDFNQIQQLLSECSATDEEIIRKAVFYNPVIFNNYDVNDNVTGSSRKMKIKTVRSILSKDEMLMITELDTIAWILNLRGQDLPNSLFFYSFLVITPDRSILFTDSSIDLEDVTVKKYDEFLDEFDPSQKVVISGDCSAYIANRFLNKRFTDDVRILQSVKNEIELYGIFRSCLYDSITLMKLFELVKDDSYTEIDISNILINLKKGIPFFLVPSFDSIIASDKNGAELHHRSKNEIVSMNKMTLMDTGSQYLFGTTDITRTLNDDPTDEMKKEYTLVLKSNLAPRLLRTEMITGRLIDRKSRELLGREGYEYESATGHGVGFGLNVHEGPPFIGRRGGRMMENQVFTIEPGIYIPGKYGIRIEDMVFLGREEPSNSLIIRDLSYVPYHLKLIDSKMLTHEEKRYINEFNRKTRCLLGGIMKEGKGSKYYKDNTKEI